MKKKGGERKVQERNRWGGRMEVCIFQYLGHGIRGGLDRAGDKDGARDDESLHGILAIVGPLPLCDVETRCVHFRVEAARALLLPAKQRKWY